MKKQERGAAVIVAVLIMMLATSTAAFALWQQSIWVRQLENISDRAKADQLATSAIDWARDELKKDGEKTAAQRTFDKKEGPNKLAVPSEDGSISGEVIDQQGRFNLNNLALSQDVNPDDQGSEGTPGKPGQPAGQPTQTPKAEQTTQPTTKANEENQERALKRFEKLLEILKLPPGLAKNVADWINDDPTGAADLDYLARDPPYRTAQRKLVDVAELARIKDFDEKKLRILAPYVTALDRATPVNINTAPPEVLSALFEDATFVRNLVERRKSEPFTSAPTVPQSATCTTANGCFDVNSNYFTATVKVKSGRVDSGYTALLERRGGGQWPSIKWRKDAAD